MRDEGDGYVNTSCDSWVKCTQWRQRTNKQHFKYSHWLCDNSDSLCKPIGQNGNKYQMLCYKTKFELEFINITLDSSKKLEWCAPDSERISMMRSAVWTQHVCDRQTDRRTELAWHTRYSMLSRVKTMVQVQPWY